MEAPRGGKEEGCCSGERPLMALLGAGVAWFLRPNLLNLEAYEQFLAGSKPTAALSDLESYPKS